MVAGRQLGRVQLGIVQSWVIEDGFGIGGAACLSMLPPYFRTEDTLDGAALRGSRAGTKVSPALVRQKAQPPIIFPDFKLCFLFNINVFGFKKDKLKTPIFGQEGGCNKTFFVFFVVFCKM